MIYLLIIVYSAILGLITSKHLELFFIDFPLEYQLKGVVSGLKGDLITLLITVLIIGSLIFFATTFKSAIKPKFLALCGVIAFIVSGFVIFSCRGIGCGILDQYVLLIYIVTTAFVPHIVLLRDKKNVNKVRVLTVITFLIFSAVGLGSYFYSLTVLPSKYEENLSELRTALPFTALKPEYVPPGLIRSVEGKPDRNSYK